MNRRTALKTLSLLGFTALGLRAQSLSSFIGGPQPTMVEFLVDRETLEVEAYRLPKIV